MGIFACYYCGKTVWLWQEVGVTKPPGYLCHYKCLKQEKE